MSRYLFFASHRTLSEGLANALQFFAGDNLNVKVLTAYMDNKPIEPEIKQLFSGLTSEDEVIIMTDILAGSVNQKFLPYISRPKTHLISGVNLPLSLAIAMEPTDTPLEADKISSLVDEARKQVVYVNALNESESEFDDEEDE